MTKVTQIVIEHRVLVFAGTMQEGYSIVIVAKPDGTFTIHRRHAHMPKGELIALNLREAIAMADVEYGLMLNGFARPSCDLKPRVKSYIYQVGDYVAITGKSHPAYGENGRITKLGLLMEVELMTGSNRKHRCDVRKTDVSPE